MKTDVENITRAVSNDGEFGKSLKTNLTRKYFTKYHAFASFNKNFAYLCTELFKKNIRQ